MKKVAVDITELPHELQCIINIFDVKNLPYKMKKKIVDTTKLRIEVVKRNI